MPKKTPALDQKGRNIWCRITTLFTPHSKNMAPDGGVFKKTGGIWKIHDRRKVLAGSTYNIKFHVLCFTSNVDLNIEFYDAF